MAKISTREDTKEIALTIYNGGFGAVKERRTVLLLPLKVQNLMGYPVHILLEKMAS